MLWDNRDQLQKITRERDTFIKRLLFKEERGQVRSKREREREREEADCKGNFYKFNQFDFFFLLAFFLASFLGFFGSACFWDLRDAAAGVRSFCFLPLGL